MTVVKRMTPTSDFLQMTAKERNCEVEEYEDCRTRNLLKKCESLEDGRSCNSSSKIYQDCLETDASKIFNCSVACQGIYADVEWSDEKVIGEKAKKENGEELDKAKLLKLVEEFQENKKRYVRNFKFTADPNSSTFGNYFNTILIKTSLVINFQYDHSIYPICFEGLAHLCFLVQVKSCQLLPSGLFRSSLTLRHLTTLRRTRR